MADPAEIARERRDKINAYLSEAILAEAEAQDYFAEEDSEEAEHLSLTRANNFRLRALCEDANLRLELPEKEDDGDQG